jgi:hypothetical protein
MRTRSSPASAAFKSSTSTASTWTNKERANSDPVRVSDHVDEYAPNDEEGCTRISMDGKRMNGVAYPQPQPSKRATSSLASTAPSASNSSKQFEQLFNPSNSFDVALRKASLTNLEKEQDNLLRESAPLSFARPAMAAPTAGYRSAPACKGDPESTADVAAIAST